MEAPFYPTCMVALVVKNPPAKAGDARIVRSSPGLGRSPGEGMTIHSSILAWRIPGKKAVWSTADHGVSKSRKQLSNLTHTQISHTPGASCSEDKISK